MQHQRVRSPRKARRLSATVLRDEGLETLHVVDVSAGGLQLEGRLAVNSGDVLALHILGGRILVKVRWIKNSRFGAAFCDVQPDAYFLNRLLQQVGTARRGFKEM